MEFGVPAEVRDLEMRVGLTPAGVLALVRAGHTVYVERDAGVGAGFSDEDYRQAGALIVYSAAEAYGRADVVVKVARPAAQEHPLFRTGQAIFSFLHLPVASPDLLEALAEGEVTAIACEMIQEQDGLRPVLLPMSEVAGRLTPIIAGQLLMSTHLQAEYPRSTRKVKGEEPVPRSPLPPDWPPHAESPRNTRRSTRKVRVEGAEYSEGAAQASLRPPHPYSTRGILLSGIPGVPPAAVVILGGGVLGFNAARSFIGLGAQVTVLDQDVKKLQHIDDIFGGRITTMLSNEYNLNRVVQFADVLVGCLLVPGRRAPVLVSRDMVRRMRPGSVIIDFSIDQGGCVETSRPTTLRSQTFVEEGIIHHCVPNMTATVARTASYAFTNAVLPYLLSVGTYGLAAKYPEGDVFQYQPALIQGVNLYRGKLAHPDVAAALGRQVEIELPPAPNTPGGVAP
jgi:alanine dehydrogenase